MTDVLLSDADQAALLGMRLNPTMWPLSKQIQAACSTAAGCAARLAGVAVPTMEDTEKTIPELKALAPTVRAPRNAPATSSGPSRASRPLAHSESATFPSREG